MTNHDSVAAGNGAGKLSFVRPARIGFLPNECRVCDDSGVSTGQPRKVSQIACRPVELMLDFLL
jgi:hypothetical protein